MHVSRLMLFLHALRSPNEPSPVNVELTKRQDAVEARIRKIQRENRQYTDRLRDRRT